MTRTQEERDALARDLGYQDARDVIDQAVRLLNRNTYDAMQEARRLLERAQQRAA